MAAPVRGIHICFNSIFFKDLFPKVLQFGLERRGGGRDKVGSKSSTVSIVISEWHTHTAADGFSSAVEPEAGDQINACERFQRMDAIIRSDLLQLKPDG